MGSGVGARWKNFMRDYTDFSIPFDMTGNGRLMLSEQGNKKQIFG